MAWDGRFFGRYNELYFGLGPQGFIDIRDRSFDKLPVPFSEELMDCADLAREPSEHTMEGPLPPLSNGLEFGGRKYRAIEGGLTRSDLGFGRCLTYRPLAARDNGNIVLLSVDLPSQVAYRIRMQSPIRNGATFRLAEGISVTVETALNWQFLDDCLLFSTSGEDGRINLLVESEEPASALGATAIVCARGHEMAGVLARAACGKGFIPCFVVEGHAAGKVEAEEIVRRQFARTVFVGLDSALFVPDDASVTIPTDIRSSSEVSRLLGEPEPISTIEAPQLADALGPALALALHYSAALSLSSEPTRRIVLRQASGRIDREWDIDEILGVPLTVHTGINSTDALHQELVVCESVIEDLIVCQGVGYASLREAPIAFLPRAGEAERQVYPDAASGRRLLEESANRAVPQKMRKPSAELITVFNRGLPLHLTSLPEAGMHWMDRYALAHLPGQLASVLAPSFLQARTQASPPVSYTVVFDALNDGFSGDDTETGAIDHEFSKGLSYPIVLRGKSARGAVLRETLQRFEIDFIVLVTHGAQDFIEGEAGEEIFAAEIAEWSLRSAPLVFNNSCSSLATTSGAFIRAGARGYIGTLWPVESRTAARLALHLSEEMRAETPPGIAMLLKHAKGRLSASRYTGSDAAAYVYVGFPTLATRARKPLSEGEELSHLTRSTEEVYQRLHLIASDGLPLVARLLHPAATSSLRDRFRSHIKQGEIPRPIQPLFGTTLDIDYVLSISDFQLGRSLIERTPHEQHGAILDGMEKYLFSAIEEWSNWNERHDLHMGRTRAEREESSRAAGISTGAISEEGLYRVGAHLAVQSVLPLATLFGDNAEIDRASFWIEVAAKLVTTPADLSADGSVTDQALIARIRTGVLQSMRLLSASDNSQEAVEIDILSNAVNKSDLANLFGIALRRVRAHSRALMFYELARDLAEPKTDRRANAESNIASVRRDLGQTDGLLEDLLNAFERQVALGDRRNAVITAANTMRIAADQQRPIDEGMLSQALSWASSFVIRTDRINHTCDLLGAASCYQAAIGRFERASRYCEEIAGYLEDESLSVSAPVHLNELLMFYERKSLHQHCVQQGKLNAVALERAALWDVAARTYVFVCDHAGKSAREHGVNWIKMFLESSRKLARLDQRHPNLMAENREGIDITRQNTASLWEQLTELGNFRLALDAYRAVQAWRPGFQEANWERLGDALHPLNASAIESMAAAGHLRREAIVYVRSDGPYSAHIKTIRQRIDDKDKSSPGTVWGYWPADPAEGISVPGIESFVVGGTVVFPLTPGAEVTVVHQRAGVVDTDGKGLYRYKDVWGSRTIPYVVRIQLEPNWIPLDVVCAKRSANEPFVWIRFDDTGCCIEFEPTDGAWLSDVEIIKAYDERLQLGSDESVFVSKTPYPIFRSFLRLLSMPRN